MKGRYLFPLTLMIFTVSVAFSGETSTVIANPPTVDGNTQGEFMDWSCYECFRPVDDPSDPVDTLWWTGNIEYHIFGAQSVSWDPDLPEMDGVYLKIKYGLWNTPSVGLAISVNGNYVGTVMANYGYISPGPKYAIANITDYIVSGPDLIEIVASYGGEAVIGYLAAGARVPARDLAGIAEMSNLPAEFSIAGPAPNPFNPTTNLSFALPVASKVNLSIYDISGRLVVGLVDGWRDAGTHEVSFDGSNLASGVYFYRLSAGNFSGTGKMILMK